MKSQIRQWTHQDGVVLVDRILEPIYPTVPAARRAAAQLTQKDPDCCEEHRLLTSAKWTQYHWVKAR